MAISPNKDVYCIICGEGSKQGGVIRLNPPGELGLWACFTHKSLFDTVASTEDVKMRAEEIKKNMTN